MSGKLEKYFMKSLEYFEEESFIVKNADVACSISNSSRNILKQKSGVNSLVISNNTEDERFNNVEPDFEAISDKYSIQKNDDIVLFVGRLTSSKNVLELIETFQEIKDQIPNGKLVIAGKPTVSEYYETLQRTAKDDVIFTEFVSDEELLALYRLSDIYTTCSIREGRNLPPAEAQKYGTPVIGFDVPGIRDIVQDGDLVEEGNYEEFGQSIVNILNES
jgi:glycosyltransferase involved in cell wall biosynthesis